MKCVIYVEGGGDRDDLRAKCRRGFRVLLEKKGFKGRMPGIRAHGGREQTFKAFLHAWEQRSEDELVLLLVDSESPHDISNPKWQHLQDRRGDGWEPPIGATEDDVFLMVQVMETWLLADRGAWERYFGKGFNAAALPSRAHLEDEPKKDVYDKIATATRGAKTKGVYGKGSHSFDLLALVDPDKIATLPHAKNFFDTLDRRLGAP